MGGSYTIPSKLTDQAAKEVILTGRLFSGEEAERMGVVMRAVPDKNKVSAQPPSSFGIAR